MEKLPRFERVRLLDPGGITNVAQPGGIAPVRQRDQLLAAGEIRGLNFVELERGKISATVSKNDRGSKIIYYWDILGRICEIDIVEYQFKSIPEKISSLYEFDERGRLVALLELRQGEFFRGDEFVYLEGRPDNEYTVVHKGVSGNVETQTYEQRQQYLLSKRRKY